MIQYSSVLTNAKILWLWGRLGLGKSLGLKFKKLIYLSTLLQEVQGYHQVYHQHLQPVPPVPVGVDQEVVEMHGGGWRHIFTGEGWEAKSNVE